MEKSKFDIDKENLSSLLKCKHMQTLNAFICTLATNKLANNANLKKALSLSESALKLMSQSPELLNDMFFDKIHGLSDRDISRVSKLMGELKSADMLDSESILKALQVATTRLPSVELSAVAKQSRKATGASRSEIVIDNTEHVFIEHDKDKMYPRGSFGWVKKGFDAQDSTTPVYSVKKLVRGNKDTSKREVKYQRLLGRNAFYYQHKTIIHRC